MFMVACELFRRHFGWKVFVIRLLYETFKEKLAIQSHHPFEFGFCYTTTCIMIVYENVLKPGTNYSRKGFVKIFDIIGISPLYSLMFIIMQM